MIKISNKLKNQLWWLIISVDYDYSRITVAEHDLDSDTLTLWLEDKHDFKNALDECLQADIPVKQFAKIIKASNLNSYETTATNTRKGFNYSTRVVINDPINWYLDDATPAEQALARDTMLKAILTHLVETDVYANDAALCMP